MGHREKQRLAGRFGRGHGAWGMGKPLPQFEEIAVGARPGTLPFWQVFLIDNGAGSGVS